MGMVFLTIKYPFCSRIKFKPNRLLMKEHIYNDTTRTLTAHPENDNSPGLELQELAQKAKDFAAAGISENTRRAYKSDWKHFVA